MISATAHDGYNDGSTFPKGRIVSTNVDIGATPMQLFPVDANGRSIRVAHITLSNFGAAVNFYLTDFDFSQHFMDFTVNATTIVIPGFYFKGTRGLFMANDGAVTNCSVTCAFYNGA